MEPLHKNPSSNDNRNSTTHNALKGGDQQKVPANTRKNIALVREPSTNAQRKPNANIIEYSLDDSALMSASNNQLIAQNNTIHNNTGCVPTRLLTFVVSLTQISSFS